MSADPRSRAQRRRDTEHRLTHDVSMIEGEVEVLEIEAPPSSG